MLLHYLDSNKDTYYLTFDCVSLVKVSKNYTGMPSIESSGRNCITH